MIGAVVLAAGASRRMGCQKVLLPFDGGTVISHIVDQILGSIVQHTLVVVGREGQPVLDALGQRAISHATNRDQPSDMLSSVRCGLRALPKTCSAAMIALGDQPRISTGVIDLLVASFERSGKGLLVPVYRGQRGHPIIMSMAYRDEVLGQYDDVGLRGLIHTHAEDLLEFPVEDAAIICDMDTPEDYQRELAAQVRLKPDCGA